MHNLRTVMVFEFVRTVKKKTFWLSVLAVPVVVALVFTIIYFSSKSASENQEKTKAEEFSVAVLDESGFIEKSIFDSGKIQQLKDKEEGIRMVKDGELDSFIFFPSNPSSETIEVFGRDVGLVKNSKYTGFARQLLKSSIIGGLNSPEVAAILQTEPVAKLVAYKDGAQAQGIEQVFVPGAFLVLFYLVIILLGNHMLTSTTEEKENRVIEIILTSVDAGSLIIGKILAMVMVGVVQISVMSLPVVIGFIFFRDKLNFPQINLAELVIDPVRLLDGAGLFIFSFLLFTGMLVTIGAVVPTAKEASSFFGIAMFFMFIPLYAASAIFTDPSQLIVKVLSFFPLSAPITLMLRNAAGNLLPWEIAIGMAILAVSSIASLFIATQAFRYGILEYDRKLNLRRLFK
ncbi:MAG: ATP-dependent Na+ efflux pump [Candidatus Falkowbacteria bacterium GW2011_GWC2_38_22]|uniref:ATP-dependent Na+ efflux pump n=1 Tax=Candidatus Falkowbacteria bacterium GW2011_GWE1_38_31 TaxID=1618638 RepID=A0A0G0K4Z1_9BACT|nr:MAG: ATP-dependent Na+ efflux pump [Candidatus Falkowbacteria bacterium GW2011_GWF2_38_1205]KKQ61718.1 MAG: ATP-dependent Na+ efflux pump [Candidatus Falkowbacteria bacterium GW2011_GWC2_38_22]KKQ63667.1 MAG: ATP-dependent Na+ efflux pump [Candidatus Falkowbacteria bacterium GW2011_GWF1_38_22]KKQ65917.1 MAG: ATP-dependent Na+ efflux pump [Candidatus Falkowbacteria bacterium GW2011_GWE2_38_254]KKQ70530.1 MAG: ATP-dependent Na+ efflux pump [Candidatus Falkowbacteria bacterium GW2011_GWE1_38_31